jgi:hypothetical protein
MMWIMLNYHSNCYQSGITPVLSAHLCCVCPRFSLLLKRPDNEKGEMNKRNKKMQADND